MFTSHGWKTAIHRSAQFIVVACLALADGPALRAADLGKADIQFFGDLYVSYRVVKKTGTSPGKPALFEKVQGLLDSSDLNVLNFEGVTTRARMPHELKRFLLKMPIWTPGLLAAAGVHAVSLANNHSMDYGPQGLFDTLGTLESQNIRHFGAGWNQRESQIPLIMQTKKGSWCLVAENRTLPPSFWARGESPGTAYSRYKDLAKRVRRCVQEGHETFVFFHWGGEGRRSPKPYQRELGRLAIDAGASAVIGAHPHILQPIEVYRGRPIFYSVGNFSFGSYTRTSPQEGLAVRLSSGIGGNREFRIVPLKVLVREDGYKTAVFSSADEIRGAKYIPHEYCKSRYSADIQTAYYACDFAKGASRSERGQASQPRKS